MITLAPGNGPLRFAPLQSATIRPKTQNCDIQRVCESCQYVNLDYADNLKQKFDSSLKILADKGLLNRTKILPPQPSERNFDYRATLKLAVRQTLDKPLRMGLFHPGTHVVVDITSCPLHVKALQELLKRLVPLLEAAGKEGILKAWNEQKNEGDLRYVVARASPATDEIQITFVVSDLEKKLFFRDLVRDLRAHGLKLVSAFLNLNTSTGNDIFGEQFLRLAGQDQLRVSLNDFLFGAGPGTFLQVNPWQASRIYNRIAQFGGRAERGEVAWDLYCGMGPITLSLARQHFRVWGVEENPHAIADANANASRNDFNPAQLSFQAGLIENELATVPLWAENPTLVVVNPSRRGLAENVRMKLHTMLGSSSRLQHVLYLSCEMKTLARDLAFLLASGARLSQIEAFDMFPHTDKLEWLAVLTPVQQLGKDKPWKPN